nr:FecR domain-containing protein [Brevundimonas diminuta]
MMTVDGDLDIRRREAAAWFTRLSQRRVSTDDVRAFSAWRRDPSNAQAYARVESVWAASKTLADDPDISRITAEALDDASPTARARSKISRLMPSLGAATAALAVLTIAVFAGAWLLTRPLTYATAVGEQRTVQLADGSRLTLDTDTQVRIRLNDALRAVTLVKGEAYFQVQGDPGRPFVVTAGDTVVTALGTRFDVRRLEDGYARVVLVEGRVQVSDARSQGPDVVLAPGQELLTTPALPAVRTVDAARATSWTTGRLVFEGMPVRSAVAEVNRYSTRKIELDAPQIAAIPVSGAFDAGDVDGFVAALVDLYGVTSDTRRDGTIVLTAPRA